MWGSGRPHGRLRAMGTLSLPRRSRPQAGSPGASRGPGRRLGATALARPVPGEVEVIESQIVLELGAASVPQADL